MGMHDLDCAFNGLCLSGKGHLTRCVFTENGWCCLHGVLLSPTELSSSTYSFQPDRRLLRKQPDSSRARPDLTDDCCPDRTVTGPELHAPVQPCSYTCFLSCVAHRAVHAC